MQQSPDSLTLKDWAILEAGKTGGGRHDGPPWDLGRGSRDRRENLHNGSVCCNLQNCMFRFFQNNFLLFILINYDHLCEKSDFLL